MSDEDPRAEATAADVSAGGLPREKLEAKEKNKKVPKKPVTNVEKKISYRDFKLLNKLN